jgi:hypothetical protein
VKSHVLPFISFFFFLNKFLILVSEATCVMEIAVVWLPGLSVPAPYVSEVPRTSPPLVWMPRVREINKVLEY